MDSEETPLHGMEEVEAPTPTDAAFDRPGTGSGESPVECLQWPWPVVECRCIAHERGAAHRLLPQTWSCLPDGGGPMADSEARASVFMNRRIRNRTSGGVGGRRGWKHPRLLPDSQPSWPCRRDGLVASGTCLSVNVRAAFGCCRPAGSPGCGGFTGALRAANWVVARWV